MKKLWMMLLMCGWLVAKPLLVVVVHPACAHCQAWENAWDGSHSELKSQVAMRLVNVTKFDDVTWVSEHFPDALSAGTPHFLVAKSETDLVEIGRFVGFSNWQRFEKQLLGVLDKNQQAPDSK